MPDSLEIHVNRKRPNVLEVPEIFVAEGNFEVAITNAGKPAHVHLNLDDDLAQVVTLDTGNHFVPRDNTFRLSAQVDAPDRPVRGKLKVSTGYGSESRFIELRVVEPTHNDSVQVDERLSEPSGRTPRPTVSSRILSEMGVLAVIFLAIIALVTGAVIVATLTTPTTGALLVLAALIVVLGVYFFL